jgi:hypothetical protein
MFQNNEVMKTQLIAALIISITLFSCKKKNDTTTNNTNFTGTWKISLSWDQKDETSNFTPYTFMFNSGGALMAHTSTTAITGTWSETNTRYTISFGSDPVLSKLNSNWLITEKTATTLKLKDDNPAQDDQLHFIKN